MQGCIIITTELLPNLNSLLRWNGSLRGLGPSGVPGNEGEGSGGEGRRGEEGEGRGEEEREEKEERMGGNGG